MFRNNTGIGMVNVLVASAMAAGLALVITKLSQQGNSSVKTAEVRFDALEYRSLLEDILRDRAACTRTLGKISTPVAREGAKPDDSINILTAHGGVYNAKGDLLWGPDAVVIKGWKLKSLKLPSKKSDPNNPSSMIQNYTSINPTLKKGFMQLQVELEKVGSASDSFGGKTKHFDLFLTTQVYNDTGVIGDPLNDYRIDWCQLSGATQASSGSASISYCNNDGTARTGSDEACDQARSNAGQGTDRYRALNCKAAPYEKVELASNLYYEGGFWKSQVWASFIKCDDGTVLVIDTGNN